MDTYSGLFTVTETRKYLQQILVRHSTRYLYPWIQILIPMSVYTDTGPIPELTGTRGRAPAICVAWCWILLET